MSQPQPIANDRTPDAVLVEVVEILRDDVGPREQAGVDTTLYVDHALWGDDAVEFLGEFARRLHVDMSQFRYESHFAPEGYGCLELLLLPMSAFSRFFKSGRDESCLIPITVGQLVEAAKMGCWPAEWSRRRWERPE